MNTEIYQTKHCGVCKVSEITVDEKIQEKMDDIVGKWRNKKMKPIFPKGRSEKGSEIFQFPKKLRGRKA